MSLLFAGINENIIGGRAYGNCNRIKEKGKVDD